MTLSLPASAFEPTIGLRNARPLRAPGPRADRIVGIAIAGVCHLGLAAALVSGIHVARAPVEKTILVQIVKEPKKAQIQVVPPPKFAPPPQVSAPTPVIEIAAPPPQNAIVAAPPRPVPPLPDIAAPAPVETPVWDGQGGYIADLLAYLDRFKQYPSAARAAHIEGVVFVHFVMARDGTVRSAQIAKSSGRALLDREALAMIARAGRLPPMPAQMKGDVLDGIIGPITFKLR